MPEINLSLTQIVATLIAVVVALTRLLNALKPRWDRIPEPFYSMIPPAIVVLPDLALRLAGVQTGTDLVIELVTAVTLMVPGARSASHKEAVKIARIVERVSVLCLAIGLSFVLQACQGSVGGLTWPKVLQCAEPVSQDVTSAVTGILMQDGDPTNVLEELARELGNDGPGVVACAIRGFLSSGSDTLKASPVHAAARARGSRFLEAHGVRE